MSETRYFRPRNWSKFQSRSNNSMAWVKNYTSLLSDPDYLELTETQRAVLHGLWLLCGLRAKPLEWSTRYLGRALHLPSQNLGRTLDILKSRNFIELCGATSLEESRGDKSRLEKKEPLRVLKKDIDSDFEKFWLGYPRQRRGAKAKAQSAWKQALLRSSSGEILAGLHDYVGSNEVRDGYAKGAAAWLNDDRWKSDYRTFREKTHEELKEEFVNGDQGSNLGPGVLDGEYVDLSGQGPKADGESLPSGTQGPIGRTGEGSGNGFAERMVQSGPAQASGYLENSEGVQATVAGLAEIAAKRAKP